MTAEEFRQTLSSQSEGGKFFVHDCRMPEFDGSHVDMQICYVKILDVCARIFSDKSSAGKMYFFPETVLNGNNERVYSQFRTGTLWQKAQEEVGSEKTIVGFGLYSDEALKGPGYKIYMGNVQ